MRCSKCMTNNPSTNNFCAKCGNALTKPCAKCKAENPPTSDFCGKCGAPLTNGIGTAVPTSTSQGSASSVRVTRESSSPEALEGERKTVTALFSDIKGSTELMRDLDPEDARAIIDPVLQLMMQAVHRYGGYVAQSTGDGIFAIFGAPIAHEDHPQRALHAALAMQKELRRYADRLRAEGKIPVEARVGVNTGEVVVRTIETGGHTEYTPVGHVTNLAARLQGVAPAGGIVISEETRRLVEGYFELRGLGKTEVKGVSEPLNIYEVVAIGALRGHFELAARRGLTKFVAREHEVAQLKRALELARSSHGQIVAAVAEAGTGKSRLVYEFKAILPGDCKVLEAYSVSHGKASAYLPVLELLYRYFGIEDADDKAARRAKIERRISALDPALSDTLPLLYTLMGLHEGPDPLAQMDPQIRRRRMLDAIKRVILRESLNQPTVVIFEDLHWIDGETQALLDLLADGIANVRVLLLVNYRPEYSHAWGNKSYYMQLRLDALGRESAGEMLSTLLGDGVGLNPLKRLIIERTEGNPFFIEEMVQALFDEGTLVRNGVVKVARPLSQLRLPSTVQAVLASRIDRLPGEQKQLLQTLAVMGRESPMGLIRQVRSSGAAQLERMLADLQAGEFIYEQVAAGDVEYVFKHALTQEVAYNSLLVERRRLLHERTGEAIEALFDERIDDHLAELAHHYSRSANVNKAVDYLGRAARQAVSRSAFAEAQAQFQKGLELLKTLPESSERDARELELASALAEVLQRTKGYAAHETAEAAARASALAEKSGSLAQLVLQRFLVWRSVLVSGNYPAAAALANQLLDLAEREGSPTTLACAHQAQLISRVYPGDLAGAEEHFARWNRVCEARGYRKSPGAFVATMGHAALVAWTLGHADSARDRIKHVIAFAHDSKNPFDLAYGHTFESTVYWELRETQHAEAAAKQALALSEEHGGFPFIRGPASVIAGWARAQLGGAREGISLIGRGLASLAEAGAGVSNNSYLAALAEAQALDGDIDHALITIEDAVRANPGELNSRPKVLTCRGELRLKIGQVELAEADFRDAIALAQKMSAKAWELRATTSLSRLLDKQGKRAEARAMLADIYNWFTEGFDTPDLKDAKALLDELNG
jgi:class 3 adenylate cyclase/tetratricopeptide (TPR) repeat protein